MKIKAIFVTNTGKVRANNEDSLLIQRVLINKTSMDKPAESFVDDEKSWFIAGDGMGGEECGEEASGETLKCLSENFPELSKIDEFSKILEKAKSILEKIAVKREIRLGTTLAGLFFSPDLNFAFNVGDCRVYHLAGETLVRLTRDHSLLEELGQSGLADFETIKNVVTSAVMGGECEEMKVFTKELFPKIGDRYLVCSDGLWGALPVENLEEALKSQELLEGAEKLLSSALESSEDNVSFIFVQILGGEK